MVLQACKKCKIIISGKECPICKERNLSPNWSGLLVIMDPENSEIAKKMNISVPGRYALKVR